MVEKKKKEVSLKRQVEKHQRCLEKKQEEINTIKKQLKAMGVTWEMAVVTIFIVVVWGLVLYFSHGNAGFWKSLNEFMILVGWCAMAFLTCVVWFLLYVIIEDVYSKRYRY